MLRKIEDFQKHWQYESEMTLKLFNALTDESLARKATEDGRSLGFLAGHITQSLGEMLEKVGLEIDAPKDSEETPQKASEIASAFEKAAKSVSDAVGKNWSNETLLQEDNLYGETWTRGLTLFYLILHQTHHRGQMSVLMRQANLKVPGIYGPAKEEWEAMGMAAMQ